MRPVINYDRLTTRIPMVNKALVTGAVVAMLALAPGLAGAQTSSTTGTGTTGSTATTGTTPGAPNTGAGGAATANILLLFGSALAVVGGTAYLSRRARTR